MTQLAGFTILRDDRVADHIRAIRDTLEGRFESIENPCSYD